MLLVSVGTGAAAAANKDLAPDEMNLIYQLGTIPSALMYAAQVHQDFLCRMIGRCIAGDRIDREVEDMSQPQPAGRAFTYARYNVELDKDGLTALGLGHLKPKDVQQMDSVDHVKEMQQVGIAAATQKVKPEHFAGFPA
jgi:hypothetical protein